MTVRVFSKPACVQCDATYRALTAAGIPYTTTDLTTNPDALEHVKQLGYMQAPVVVTDTEHWSGFRPDLITQHAKRLKED